MITSGMFNNRVDKDVMVATLRMTDINVDSAPLNAGNYLDDFLTNLASLLSADTLYVATVCPTTLEPSILSSIQQGQPVNGLDINFHSMPCFIAYQRGYAEYDRNLASRFPAQVQLQRWQSQAYIGIRLNDLTDKPLGILSVFFNRELAPHKLELNLIRLLADFLARELSANPPALMPAANMPPLDPAAPQSVYRHWFEDNIKQGRSEHSVRSVFNITTESKKIEQQNIPRPILML